MAHFTAPARIVTNARNPYLWARLVMDREPGIRQRTYELTAPFTFSFGSAELAFTHLAVWQFPERVRRSGEGQPATQLVGFVHDPTDNSVAHDAYVLETWTGDGTSEADALLNAEVFGPEGSGYRIW